MKFTHYVTRPMEHTSGLTDVPCFVITDQRVDVLFGSIDTDISFTRHTLLNLTSSSIDGIMLTDFNADQNMDILVIHRQQDLRVITEIYWGKNDKMSVGK